MTALVVAPHLEPITNTVPLRHFYPDAADIIIERPGNLFLPDTWTLVFARGLRRAAEIYNHAASAHVLEVGVGTGVNMAGLITLPPHIRPAYYTGTDICHDAVTASSLLAQQHDLSARLIQSDLLASVPDVVLSTVTHIAACIPQVPTQRPEDLTKGDNYAHYYAATGTNWDQHGLGLNARLLEQATSRAPQAAVTLNLAGRPGIDRLKDLFAFHGRHPEIMHEETVPQHAGTSLASLAAKENAGHSPFEFFADAAGTEKLSAKTAEARRLVEAPIYHKVYVITAPGL